MNPIDAEALLSRLPAFYRQRDEELGGPLLALLAVMAAQGELMRQDIARLYDDSFIETCDESLLPYIGDLLGALPMHGIPGSAAAGQRTLVANTLRLRRRKGTLPVLEEVAAAATGWRASASERFERLATTQHMNHVRPANLRMPNLRNAAALERIGGAFDSATFSADVRRIDARGAGPRPNIANVALFLWRLSADPVQRATAAAVAGAPGRYTFEALGRSLPLVNRPASDVEPGSLATPQQVPEPLSRRALADELKARRQAIADGRTPETLWFAAPPSALSALSADDRVSVLHVWLDDAEVPPEDLVVCHLGELPGVLPADWRRPPAAITIGATAFPRGPAACLVGIDPVLGRLALPAGRAAARVEVGCATAFPGDVGGGPYDRRPARAEDEAAQGLQRPADYASVFDVPGTHATLAAALAAVVIGSRTLIRLLDDRSHAPAAVLDLKGTTLAIEAANKRRPVWLGDIALQGDAQTRLLLSGLLIDGALQLNGPLRAVELRHCSLVPARGGITHTGNAPGLAITLTHSLVGPLRAANALASVDADSCVIDSAGAVPAAACTLPDTTLTLNRCTLFGSVACGELAAGHSLFDGRVSVQHRQQGCVRFCWVPPGTAAAPSVTPRRYRCQPDLVMRGLPAALAAAEALRVSPAFNATAFGSARYAQLATTTASEIRGGAENGAEIGVWNGLAQAQREANLRQALDEYLRFGLEAGAIFAD